MFVRLPPVLEEHQIEGSSLVGTDAEVNRQQSIASRLCREPRSEPKLAASLQDHVLRRIREPPPPGRWQFACLQFQLGSTARHVRLVHEPRLQVDRGWRVYDGPHALA